jgi:hypothetical protein
MRTATPSTFSPLTLSDLELLATGRVQRVREIECECSGFIRTQLPAHLTPPPMLQVTQEHGYSCQCKKCMECEP